MRTTVIGYVGFFIIMLQLLILSTLVSNTSYQDVMTQSLEDSVDLSISMLQLDFENKLNREINNSESISLDDVKADISWSSEASQMSDIKKDFIAYMVENLDSRITDINVNIYGADSEDGLLSVEVTAKFKYFDGRPGAVTCYRTAILNNVER